VNVRALVVVLVGLGCAGTTTTTSPTTTTTDAELVRIRRVRLEHVAVPEACGLCVSGLELVGEDGTRTVALPRGPDEWHTLEPFVTAATLVDVSGEHVTHPGACGEGTCESFQILGVSRAE
jgi:hypothetical protein